MRSKVALIDSQQCCVCKGLLGSDSLLKFWAMQREEFELEGGQKRHRASQYSTMQQHIQSETFDVPFEDVQDVNSELVLHLAVFLLGLRLLAHHATPS